MRARYNGDITPGTPVCSDLTASLPHCVSVITLVLKPGVVDEHWALRLERLIPVVCKLRPTDAHWPGLGALATVPLAHGVRALTTHASFTSWGLGLPWNATIEQLGGGEPTPLTWYL